MIRVNALIILVLVVLGVVGCQSWPWERGPVETAPEADLFEEEPGVPMPAVPERGLRLSAEQRFRDVPLPVGVKEDSERTFVYESPDLQMGRLVYTLRASAAEVAQFYVDEAPAADWKRTRMIQGETIEIVFVKPGRRLTVGVRDRGVARGTELTLTLIPEPHGDAMR